MGVSEYMRRLREKVGNDYVLIPTAGAVIPGYGGRILLVRHTDGHWQLPGGAIDPDESPEDAMRRECREEASIEMAPVRIAGVFGGPLFRASYANGDEVGIVATVFGAEIVDGAPAPGDDETIEVGWFSAAELEALPLRSIAREMLRRLATAP